MKSEANQVTSRRAVARLIRTGSRSIDLLRGSGGAQAALALIDQLIVSGTNFVTLLLLGRLAGPHDLGIFALIMPLFYLLLAVQESLITVPYTIFGARLKGARHRQYSGAALRQSLAWSACVTGVLVVAAAGILFIGKKPDLASVVGIFAVVSPLWLLREFGRRYLFAHLAIAKVVVMTIVGSSAQLGVLAALAYGGWISAATAIVAIGVGSGIAGVGWLWFSRGSIDAPATRRLYFLRKNWVLGRWLLASQAMPLISGNVLLWLILAWLGPKAIGVFAACDAILRFANPIIITFVNVLTPRVAIGLTEGGKVRLRRIVWKATALLSLFLFGFTLLMMIAGDWIMVSSFGAQYRGAWATLVVLSLSQFVARLAFAPGRALLVLEHANLILLAEVAGLFLELASAPVLIQLYGILGAAFSALAGSLAMAALTVGFYLAAMREDEPEPAFRMDSLTASAATIGGTLE